MRSYGQFSRLRLSSLLPKKFLEPIRLLRWLVAGVMSFIIVFLPLDYFESYLYDLRVVLRPTPPISPIIETILIDLPSVQKNKGVPTLLDHIHFLQQLKTENPRAIVYLINPAELQGSDEEKKIFADLATSMTGFYFIKNDTALRGEVGKFDLPGFFKSIRVFSGPLTSDTKFLAQDGVTRRMMLTYQGNILFHPFLASQLIPERAMPENIRGHFELFDSEQAYIDMAPAQSFPRTSFIDVVEAKHSKGRFLNKIIFVGSDLGQSTEEYVKTSYSRKVTAMTTAEAHANILNTLIQNSGPQTIPNWINVLILLLMVILSVEIVLAMKPIKGLIVLGLSLSLFIVASFIAFWPFGFWINMAHPILGLFITYYFLIPYRLIMENRRSWELYQKNKLLTQVEELKTNFMGMMSHDLKTPLARIQGMLEIVNRDKNPLSTDQKTAIKSIQQSTQDLLNFISSILSFSRLESQGAHLNLKSKDINTLVEEAILKAEYLAQEKKIVVIKELEPLFNMKIDPDLIRQVIFNLVENAIKYSPENTTVKVKSEEINNKVQISVVDQGMGIPEEELSRLFMKFFRSRNAKNSGIKGSGLGLYLAKYFIELHKGSLTVQSKENEGSRFIIELPIHD